MPENAAHCFSQIDLCIHTDTVYSLNLNVQIIICARIQFILLRNQHFNFPYLLVIAFKVSCKTAGLQEDTHVASFWYKYIIYLHTRFLRTAQVQVLYRTVNDLFIHLLYSTVQENDSAWFFKNFRLRWDDAWKIILFPTMTMTMKWIPSNVYLYSMILVPKTMLIGARLVVRNDWLKKAIERRSTSAPI